MKAATSHPTWTRPSGCGNSCPTNEAFGFPLTTVLPTIHRPAWSLSTCSFNALVDAGVDAIVAQKGVVSAFAHLCEGTKTNMVVHYSVSTRHAGPDASNKVLVGHADETLVRGGMGVSSQVNMGSENEASMIERMGELNRQALHADLPSFGMVYARGPHLNHQRWTSPVRKRTPSVWPLSWVAMRQNAYGRATTSFEPSPPAPRFLFSSQAGRRPATPPKSSPRWNRPCTPVPAVSAWDVRCSPTQTHVRWRRHSS